MVNLVFACILDSTANQKATGRVDERKATLLGILSHGGEDVIDTLWLLAFVWPPRIHLGGDTVAGAVW